MTNDAGTMRRYLLGDLAEPERESLEARYFADPEVLERLGGVEESLIEEYIDGRLPVAERERLERHYLAVPAHRARVAVTRDLRRRGAEATAAGTAKAGGARAVSGSGRPRRERRQAFLALAAAAVLVAAGLVALRMRDVEPGSPPEAPTVASATTPAGGTAAPASRAVIALALPAIALRSEGALPTVRRVAQPADLELVVDLAAAAPAGPFAVTVRTLEDVTAWQGRAATSRDVAGAASVRVRVPFEALPPDDYVVVLQSTEPGTTARTLKVAFRVAAAEVPK